MFQEEALEMARINRNVADYLKKIILERCRTPHHTPIDVAVAQWGGRIAA